MEKMNCICGKFSNGRLSMAPAQTAQQPQQTPLVTQITTELAKLPAAIAAATKSTIDTTTQLQQTQQTQPADGPVQPTSALTGPPPPPAEQEKWNTLFTKLDSMADLGAANATRLDSHDTQLNMLDVRSAHTAGELEKLTAQVKANDVSLSRALLRCNELEVKIDGLAASMKRPSRSQLQQSGELATLKRSVADILDKLDESTRKRLRRISQVNSEEIDSDEPTEGSDPPPASVAVSPVVGAPRGGGADGSRASQRSTGRRERNAR